MKEAKLLNRVQAVEHRSFNLTLATVREPDLKSELACIQLNYFSAG